MAQDNPQPDLETIRLCADLAKFAYTSGDPGSPLSSRKDQAAKKALLRELPGDSPHVLEDILDFKRYYSSSWFVPKSLQPKWFRSYAYFCHIKGYAEAGTKSKEEVSSIDRIIVGFRGTWNNSSGSGKWLEEDDDKSVLRNRVWSRILTWFKNKLTPSSKYGLSDFYYDAMLIRIPYRKGPIWKWYAYWGSLILQTTSLAPRLFTLSRIVARYWMERPNIYSSEQNAGYVHLGFWSLWASPEGFAGYDSKGNVLHNDSVITSFRQALAKSHSKDTVVYVVGHSLGGAVSSFAALDFAKELEGYPNATMYHVTFGSPPIGTADFEAYFSSKLGRHRSWSISHKQDLIPQCFAWCASRWYLRWLNWWSDWSCVGEKMSIMKLTSQEPYEATERAHGISVIEKCKFLIAGLGVLIGLSVLRMLVVPISLLWYFQASSTGSFRRYRLAELKEDYEYPHGHEKPPAHSPNLGLNFHSLQTYIDLMQYENDLETPIEVGTDGRSQVVEV